MRFLIDTLTRNWWVFVVRGVLTLLFGIVAWVWPDLTISVLVILFGAYVLVDGLFAVIVGFASQGTDRRWWAEVLVGIAGIVLGIMTFFWPDVTALALLYLIASWAIISGVFEIVAAIQLRQVIESEWFLGLAGLLSIVLGVLLFLFPGEGAISLIWLIGSYAILAGLVMIVFGVRARNFRNNVREMQE